MNDKELADRVVELGVGEHNQYRVDDDDSFFIPNTLPSKSAVDFVRDWRVAGALMEKAEAVYLEALVQDCLESVGSAWQAQTSINAMPTEWIDSISAPRAIIEACVEALS